VVGGGAVDPPPMIVEASQRPPTWSADDTGMPYAFNSLWSSLRVPSGDHTVDEARRLAR
jgi:hypothetical protein